MGLLCDTTQYESADALYQLSVAGRNYTNTGSTRHLSRHNLAEDPVLPVANRTAEALSMKPRHNHDLLATDKVG